MHQLPCCASYAVNPWLDGWQRFAAEGTNDPTPDDLAGVLIYLVLNVDTDEELTVSALEVALHAILPHAASYAATSAALALSIDLDVTRPSPSETDGLSHGEVG